MERCRDKGRGYTEGYNYKNFLVCANKSLENFFNIVNMFIQNFNFAKQISKVL